MSGQIQAIYFMAPAWNGRSARAWLAKHKYVPIKPVHVVSHELRYRIREPNFSRYVTKILHDKADPLKSVHLVIGY